MEKILWNKIKKYLQEQIQNLLWSNYKVANKIIIGLRSDSCVKML